MSPSLLGPKHGYWIWPFSKLSTVHGSLGLRNCIGSLEACIFEIIALNQKKFFNFLTNFLRSFHIDKGLTSDISTLMALYKRARNLKP
jgi:hypothetical protein